MQNLVALTCAVAVLTLGLSAAQTPGVSPIRPLPGDALVGLATGDQATPTIARGGSGHLVAWSDRRTTLSSNAGGPESGTEIFAVRLDANGQRIESTPFALSNAPGADTAPLVEWNGQNWLVVWKSQGPLASQYSSAVVGVRVSPQGALLDSAPLVILPYAFSEIGTLVLASDGANWIVAAQGTSGGSANVRAARVSPAGALLDTAPVELIPESGQLMNFELAYAQGSFLVVWSRYSGTSDDVIGRRFSSALSWQDAAPFTIGATAADDSWPQIGSNGSQFLVAWQGGATNSTWSNVHAARVASSGQVLDASPLTLVTNMYYGVGPQAAPAFDGTNWFVSWNDNGARFARINSSGVLLDANGFLADATANSTLVAPLFAAAPTSGVQLVWSDARAGSYEGLDVYTARLNGPAGVGTQSGISSGASAHVTADLVHGKTNSLLVFRSETSGVRRILASRLDANGLALDAEPLVVASGLLEGEPSAAFDGSVYLITWESASNALVYTRRLAQDGAWLDAQPVSLGIGARPEAAGMNGEFLVSYVRSYAFPLMQYPHYVRLRGSDGAVLGAPVVLSSNYAIETDVCTLDGRWLVVWQRNYWNNDTHSDVNAAFVDTNGVATAPFWVAGTFNAYNHSVSVASSGGEALISWVFGTASNLTRRVHTRRIDGSGAFLDANPAPLVASVNAEQFNPSASWNGSEYVVAWQDLRASTSMIDTRSDLYVARVTPQGALLDPLGVAVELGDVSECGPALVGIGGGRALLASSRFDSSSGFAAYRMVLRTVDGACPAPQAYCTAKSTSLGTLPTIGFSGAASVAQSSFQLQLTGGVPNVSALSFSGAARAALPFAGGVMCTTTPLVRQPLVTLDGNGAAQTTIAFAQGFVGQVRCFQWWMRDPQNPDGTNVALSNALEVVLCP